MENNGAIKWNIEKVISKGDYNYVIVRDHPKATSHGYVLEHRVVLENHLGRILDDDEVVHHLDGDKKNNCIHNLEVMTNREHARLHQLDHGRKMVELRCPNCFLIFERGHNNTHLTKKSRYTCCSNRCRGQLSRRIQLHGITDDVQDAISVNVQKEFIRFLENTEGTPSQDSVETTRIPPETVKI
jgi:hypothetical protein